MTIGVSIIHHATFKVVKHLFDPLSEIGTEIMPLESSKNKLMTERIKSFFEISSEKDA